MNPQAHNGVFDARMFEERGAELYSLQSVGSSLSVPKVSIDPFAGARKSAKLVIMRIVSSCRFVEESSKVCLLAWIHMFWRCSILLFGAALAVLPKESIAVEYELEGTIKTTQYDGGSGRELETLRFHVFVRDCEWLIRVIPEVGGRFAQRIQYWEMASDGQGLYSFAAKKPSANGTETWGGGVSRNSVPKHLLLPQIPVLWFAAASSCFLDNSNLSMLPPYSQDVIDYPVNVEIIREKQEPSLARNAVFFSDGYNPRFPEPTKYPAPFDKGFTNATYQALAFTNVGSLLLASEFSLRVFRQSPNGLVTAYLYRGLTSRAHWGCSLSDFKPRIPSGKDGPIKDFRFVSADAKSEHAFRYNSTQWLSIEQVQKLEGFSNYVVMEAAASTIPGILVETKSTIPAASSGRKSVRIAILSSLIIIALLPVLLWRLSRSKNTKLI